MAVELAYPDGPEGNRGRHRPESFQSNITDFPQRIPPGIQVAGQTIYLVKQISVTQGYFGQRFGFGTIVFLASPASFAWVGVRDPVVIRSQLEQGFNRIQETQYVAREAQEKFVDRVGAHYTVMNEAAARSAAAGRGMPPGMMPPNSPPIGGPGPKRVLVGNQVVVECTHCGSMVNEGTLKSTSCGASLVG